VLLAVFLARWSVGATDGVVPDRSDPGAAVPGDRGDGGVASGAAPRPWASRHNSRQLGPDDATGYPAI
jgi:hypothetical protein